MNPQILNFLTSHHVCSLTTLLKDGTPHAAAIHFSHNETPFELYFSTENTTRKCEALLTGNSTRASVVVGFSEEEWVTIQMEGNIQAVLDQTELQKVQAIHYAKHPGSAKYKDEPETIFLKFTPTWWRYTDYNTEPATIVLSETAQ